jgi:hypothetical protein
LTDGNPVTTHLNAAPKYVVSRTLERRGCLADSILLRGDAVDAVAELKAQSGRDLSIIGSASLVRSLHAAGTADLHADRAVPVLCAPRADLGDRRGYWRPGHAVRRCRITLNPPASFRAGGGR